MSQKHRKEKFPSLPGFRSFYPDDCLERNYLFDTWRDVARRYGFFEYEGPILESTDLYRKKSGAEIVDQLFHFQDKGDREVAMRPELTPTLARMAANAQREFKKPMKWFGIGRFFRYEKPQKGRLREFYQWNVDILGDPGPGADAELIALAIDAMRELGFGPGDFRIRLSNRSVWSDFAHDQGIANEDLPKLLQIIDKMEREKPDVTAEKLDTIACSMAAVEQFCSQSRSDGHAVFGPILENLSARGMAEFVEIDLGIVRGLAYYTGTVFEIFDAGNNNRAVAGGGRYDGLVGHLTDGAVDLPACGFAMGDVVITDFIHETKGAKSRLMNHLSEAGALDVFVIVADENRRNEAAAIAQRLRLAGHRVDWAISQTKTNKQFEIAEHLKAKCVVVVGSDFPMVQVKNSITREHTDCSETEMLAKVAAILANPGIGPLWAEQRSDET